MLCGGVIEENIYIYIHVTLKGKINTYVYKSRYICTPPKVQDAVAKFDLEIFRHTRFLFPPYVVYRKYIVDRQASPSPNDRGPSLVVDKTVMSSLTDGSFIGLKDEEAVVVF